MTIFLQSVNVTLLEPFLERELFCAAEAEGGLFATFGETLKGERKLGCSAPSAKKGGVGEGRREGEGWVGGGGGTREGLIEGTL